MPEAHSPLWNDIAKLPPRASETSRYLLVNQAAFASALEPLKKLGAFERCALLGQSKSACQDGATPFVLQADGMFGQAPNSRAIQQLCDAGCYACAISVLDSPLKLDAIAAALTARCDVELPDRHSMLLRYFDTRIMEPLLGALDPSQLVDFLSCTTNWYYANRDGRLEYVYSRDPTGVDTFVPPLRLSAAQQATLIEAGEVDSIIDLLLRNKVGRLLDITFSERYAAISQCVESARSWGLTATSDLAAFCTLSLHSGFDFFEQTPWKELLSRVKRGEISFSEAMDVASKAGK